MVTSDDTVVTRSTDSSLADVAVGDQVRVMGTTSGTTVTAERITDSGTTVLDSGPGAPGGQAPQGQAPQGQAPQGQAQNGQAPQGQGQQGQQGQAPQGQGQGGPGRAVQGQVTAIDGGTLTVSAADGTTTR